MAYTQTRTFIAAGTAANGTTAAVTYGLPAGITAGARLILVLESDAQRSISNANGGTWTLVGTYSVTGSVITVFESKYAGAGQGSVSVGAAADHQVGRTYAFTGSAADGDAICAAVVQNGENVSDTSWSISGTTTTVNNSLVVICATRANDATSTTAFSAWTNASLASITEAGEFGTTSGNGGGGVVAYGVDTTAGTVDATTVTNSTATVKAWVVFALAPISVSDVSVKQYVQQTTTNQGSSSTSANTFASATLSGSSILFHVGYWATVDAALTVADSVNAGNYTLVQSVTDTVNNYTFAQFVKHNVSAGTPTVTATFGSAKTYTASAAYEIANVDTASPIAGSNGQFQANPTTGTDATTSGAITIAAGNRLIIGTSGEATANTAPTVGTGFTQLGAAWNTTGSNSLDEYKRITSGTAAPATYTAPNTNGRATLGIVFNEASTGASGTCAAALPDLSASASASVGQAVTCTTATTLPDLSASASITVGAFTPVCTLAATLPDLSSSAAMSVGQAVTSTCAASLPNLSAFAVMSAGSYPTIGISDNAYKVYQSAGNSVTTPSRTKTLGSVLVAGAGILDPVTESAAPTDTASNTFTPINTLIYYQAYAQSGVRIWAKTNSAGTTGYQMTKTCLEGSETTVGYLEILNANTVSTPLQTAHVGGLGVFTSQTVTTTGPAVLVCYFHGEGYVTTPSTASAGWALQKEYQATASSIHQAIFAREVTAAGTYSCTVTSAQQGVGTGGITSIFQVYQQNSVTSTCAATLPDLTASATVSVGQALTATCAATLPALSATAAASVGQPVTVACTATLPNLSASASLTVVGVVSCVAAATLPALAASASALVGEAVTGTCAATLPNLTATAGASVGGGVSCALAATLPALSCSATASVGQPVIASLQATLPAPTASATGSVGQGVTFAANATLPAPAAFAVGIIGQAVTCAAAATLPDPAATFTVTVLPLPPICSLAATLPELTAAATALVGQAVTCSMTATLPGLSASASGGIGSSANCSAAATLPDLSASATLSVGVPVTFAATAILPGLSAQALALVGSGVFCTAAATLPDLSLVASCETSAFVECTAAATLPDLEAFAVLNIEHLVIGECAATLPDFACSASLTIGESVMCVLSASLPVPLIRAQVRTGVTHETYSGRVSIANLFGGSTSIANRYAGTTRIWQ